MPAGLHDLDRAAGGAHQIFHPQADHGVGDRFLVQGGEPTVVQRHRFEGQDRGQVLALQALHQDVEGLARIAAFGAERQQAGGAVDEDAARADLARLLEQQAVGLLQLLAKHVARGIDDLQLVAALEPRQVEAQPRRVARQLVGRDLEHHDHAGLVELRDAAVHEFHAHRRLAGADGALEQDHVAARDAAGQDGIEAGDAGPDALGFGQCHVRRLW